MSGVRQGDGLPLILYNSALETELRECNKKLKKLNIYDSIKFRTMHKFLMTNLLAFTNELVVLTNNNTEEGKLN